jgi:hypothetical protein
MEGQRKMCYLYHLPNIKVNKSRKMKCAGHDAHIEKNALRIFYKMNLALI